MRESDICLLVARGRHLGFVDDVDGCAFTRDRTVFFLSAVAGAKGLGLDECLIFCCPGNVVHAAIADFQSAPVADLVELVLFREVLFDKG